MRATIEELGQLWRKVERNEARCRGLFEILPRLSKACQLQDAATRKALPRQRGERGKLAGGILLEDVAVDIFKKEKRYLIDQRRDDAANRGVIADECADAAAEDVALVIGGFKAIVNAPPLLTIQPGTIRDWARRDRARERGKPKEQRRYALHPKK